MSREPSTVDALGGCATGMLGCLFVSVALAVILAVALNIFEAIRSL